MDLSDVADLKRLTDFPPHLIQDEATLQATQTWINQLLDGQLDDDIRDYLRVLGMLVYEYEARTEVIPLRSPEERAQALTAEA
ncbi:hypothetical protein IQ266_26550 [filamentous cyanobacterium LEGE 11480]|uniref:Transcriptional regulator n=1 Tax=Romeriopsis navalis LEGE 11480 TaxID=2777977 RepID=A0A928VRB0_9CYAN|nr:hypothetical protein [Romeriopsis navalis]MBE9033298.1 hypothetical protein [Romeriopsis navalis LEGE 11480]